MTGVLVGAGGTRGLAPMALSTTCQKLRSLVATPEVQPTTNTQLETGGMEMGFAEIDGQRYSLADGMNKAHTGSVWYKCLECGAKSRDKHDNGHGGCNLCEDCYDLAGWENQHSDDGHEVNPDADCPICQKNKAEETEANNWEASYDVTIKSSRVGNQDVFDVTIKDQREDRVIEVRRATFSGAVEAVKEYIDSMIWRIDHKMHSDS